MLRRLAILTLLALPAQAQLVAGPWVDRAEARIREHRMADLEVRVLDARDRPVAGARVRVTQLRHAFPFGVELPAGEPALLEKVGDPDLPVWRGLSSVSLAAYSAWPVLQPEGPQTDPGAARLLGGLLDRARVRGLRVRVAPLAPGDPADRPGWAAGLPPAEREQAAVGFFRALAGRLRGRVHAADLASSVVDHPWLDAGGLRRLGHAARAAWAPAGAGGAGPPVRLGLGVRGALEEDRGGAVLAEAAPLRQAFLPVDGVTTPLTLTGATPPEELERTLQRLTTFAVEAAVVPLSVGGPPADQPFGLEGALILLFAEPRVTEVQLAGVEPGREDALFDAAGNPTAGGEAVDALIAGRWWTAEVGATDTLGDARFRVFAGLHRVEVELPGGEAGSAEVAVGAGGASLAVAGEAREKERE